jgi:hypothetical protein
VHREGQAYEMAETHASRMSTDTKVHADSLASSAEARNHAMPQESEMNEADP